MRRERGARRVTGATPNERSGRVLAGAVMAAAVALAVAFGRILSLASPTPACGGRVLDVSCWTLREQAAGAGAAAALAASISLSAPWVLEALRQRAWGREVEPNVAGALMLIPVWAVAPPTFIMLRHPTSPWPPCGAWESFASTTPCGHPWALLAPVLVLLSATGVSLYHAVASPTHDPPRVALPWAVAETLAVAAIVLGIVIAFSADPPLDVRGEVVALDGVAGLVLIAVARRRLRR